MVLWYVYVITDVKVTPQFEFQVGKIEADNPQEAMIKAWEQSDDKICHNAQFDFPDVEAFRNYVYKDNLVWDCCCMSGLYRGWSLPNGTGAELVVVNIEDMHKKLDLLVNFVPPTICICGREFLKGLNFICEECGTHYLKCKCEKLR